MFRNSGWSFAILEMISHAVLLSSFLLTIAIRPASGAEKPKVRTITAFIRLDVNQYTQQVADTLTMLRNAKARYELAGYEVESIRISTQPFPGIHARHVEASCARVFPRSRQSREAGKRRRSASGPR